MLELLNIAAKVAPNRFFRSHPGASGTGKDLLQPSCTKTVHAKTNNSLLWIVHQFGEPAWKRIVRPWERRIHRRARNEGGHCWNANGGTLFLDEIGEISLMIQPKLLRFLQTGEYRRVGGNKNFKSDVRVISATNKNLHDEIGIGNSVRIFYTG